MSNFYKVMYNEQYNKVLANQFRSFLQRLIRAEEPEHFIYIYQQALLMEIGLLNMERGLNEFIPEMDLGLQGAGSITEIELISNFCLEKGKKLEPTIKQVATSKALCMLHATIALACPFIEKNVPDENQEEPKRITIKPEIISSLHTELKVYFSERDHHKLLAILEGRKVAKAVFLSNANRLVEVFRRLKYNGFIIESYKHIENWIYESFMFQNEASKQTSRFKLSTIHSILYGKETALPGRNKRILNVDWLPYKSTAQLKKSDINIYH